MPTAVVIDGAFFLRRFHHSFPDLDRSNAHHVANAVVGLAAYHTAAGMDWAAKSAARDAVQQSADLIEPYRTFFYDCPPLEKPMKLARREGIDVVLDPMGANAASDLVEHVDGVRTVILSSLLEESPA